MTDSRAKGAQFERFCVNYIKDNLGESLPELPKRNLSQYQVKGEADIVIPGWSIELGMGYTGIEKNEDVFGMACKRVERHLRQGNLFRGAC